ncbi:MAG: extensin family protein [Hyphomicrobiaceae bacterium]
MARLLRFAGPLLALGTLALPVTAMAQTVGAPAPGVASARPPSAGGPGAGVVAPGRMVADPPPPSALPAAPHPPAIEGRPKSTPQWPKTLDQGNEPPPGTEATTWSPAEIAAAQTYCAVILSDLQAVVLPADPVREGECGAPAPVQLISIGQSPQVTLSQPALVTCEMVAALHRWMKESVQPAARKHLGSQIIRMQIMSDYSCRKAYGRKKARLSEHGRANALDVRGFLTERNTAVELTSAWGMTARDVRAQVAAAEAAKRAAEKRAAELAAQAKSARTKAAQKSREGTDEPPAAGAPTAAPDLRGPIADPQAIVEVPKLPDLGLGKRDPQTYGLTPPSRLGGPKTATKDAQRQDAGAGPGDAAARQQAFLRQIHAEACKYFGTVLGPESNEAHRDHFHLDMAERAVGNFCE